jgi:hypothetical protein
MTDPTKQATGSSSPLLLCLQCRDARRLKRFPTSPKNMARGGNPNQEQKWPSQRGASKFDGRTANASGNSRHFQDAGRIIGDKQNLIAM